MTNNAETRKSTDRFTVRVTRDDGSVTYKCSRVSLAHAEREAAAWHAEGLAAIVVNCSNQFYRDEQRAWRRAIIAGNRFYPAELAGTEDCPLV